MYRGRVGIKHNALTWDVRASNRGLAVSYFHTALHRTSIGAEAFHGPVRDGKGWDHLAMAARLKLLGASKNLIFVVIRCCSQPMTSYRRVSLRN